MELTINLPDEDVEALLEEILQNIPEYSVSLTAQSWDYKRHVYTFTDEESDNPDTVHTLTLDKARKAFGELAAKWLGNGRVKLGMILDGSAWDAPAVDALIQQGLFGEVVYG